MFSGIAMTLYFTNPLFTLLFNACMTGKCPGVLKMTMVFIFIAGVVLIIQPPFLPWKNVEVNN